jgi:hypothetical protein
MTELNYQIWATKEIFTVEQAAYLWEEKEPPRYRFTCDECLKKRASIHPLFDYGSETGAVIAELIEKYIELSSDPNRLKVTRKELEEIANKAGMKPKFLFPEMREGARWNELGTPAKGAYQELIKVLLHGLNHNPKDSSTVGKIEALVAKFQTDKELNEANISRRTIEGILKEIAPSRKRLPKNAK